MIGRRAAVLLGALLLTAGAAGAAAVGFGGSGAGSAPQDTGSPATAPVTRETLVESGAIPGQLDHGASTPIELGGANGTITWLPAVGRVIRRGTTVVRIDEHPVPLLYGALPMYRPLAPGVEGPDVKQFERNLRALGYTGFTVDDEYSASTATAVRDWQDDLGVPETGTIQPGQVVYAPRAIRVAEVTGRVGAPASGPLLSYGGTAKVVTVQAAADDVTWARKGARVMVTPPSTETVAGVIASVGTAVTAAPSSSGPPGQDNQPPTVPVTITIADQRALSAYDRAPVEVRYTAGQRADVLTVPVLALLALAEGGYGVEIVSGGSSRIVAVETGLFADGRVEVRGADLSEGVPVAVPE